MGLVWEAVFVFIHSKNLIEIKNVLFDFLYCEKKLFFKINYHVGLDNAKICLNYCIL